MDKLKRAIHEYKYSFNDNYGTSELNKRASRPLKFKNFKG